MATTHKKLRYSPKSKGKKIHGRHCRAGCGAGVQSARRTMEAPHPVPSVWRKGPALLGAGASYSGDFPEDADPAASADGKRRHGPSDCPPSGAAESRIWINRLGSGSMPRARRFAEMG